MGNATVSESKRMAAPIAVNFHFSRKCNYECGFCFHTAKSSNKLPLEQAKELIRKLSDAGCKKLNFAGGEPFLPDHTGKDNYLGEMVKFAKQDCGFESVSIISNARFIKEEWFEKYAEFLDMLGVSCDSADDTTNAKIGRGKKGDHTEYIKRAATLCRKYQIMFKLNTVVNRFNVDEDMSALVNEIEPMRWKLFQVLGVEGENNGVGVKRDVGQFLIEKWEFDAYIQRHRQKVANAPDIMKIEDNETMQSSYVLIDENGCFLDCSTGQKIPTGRILDIGVHAAWQELTSSTGGGFDEDGFMRRDGLFQWTRARDNGVQIGQPVDGVVGSGSGGCGGDRGGVVDIEDVGGR